MVPEIHSHPRQHPAPLGSVLNFDCFPLRYLLVLITLLWPAGVNWQPLAQADDEEKPTIQWLHDYAAARKLAKEKGLPLFLDFGTKRCFWCKQLDARTFIDPEVISILNKRFIPVKVDGDSYQTLVEALHIQSYPTLIYAQSDGRIVGFQEGFLDKKKLKEQLQRILAMVTAPPWMIRDFKDAQEAFQSSDFSRACELLKRVAEDGRTRPEQVKARKLIAEIEDRAEKQWLKVKAASEKLKVDKALAKVNAFVRQYSGTSAARKGRQMLLTLAAKERQEKQLRTDRARVLLQEAKEDYRQQEFLCCLDRCDLLLKSYADLPQAKSALEMKTEIVTNPAWTKKACDSLSERLSSLYLALAESWLKKGQPQQAVFYLQRVIRLFPGSKHADAAQARLTLIQGAPGPMEMGAKGERTDLSSDE